MIKVSIIVPVYNTSLYLEECLQSLVSQTLQDIEIICINDGSTDESPDILRRFSEKYSNIAVIDKPNTGYGNTMNIGIDAAKGEYIGIVESDDFASPEMFEELYELGKRNEAEIVKSNFYEYNEDRKIFSGYREILKQCKYDEVFMPMEDNAVFFAHICIWSAIYKRSFLKDNDIKLNETKGASYQDVSFNFKVLALTKRMVLTRKAYMYYRTDSWYSSVNSIEKIYCICDEYNEVEKFIDKCEPAMKQKLEELATTLKIKGYLWNYQRLASAFQYTFLQKIIEDFKEDDKKGRIKKELWDEDLWIDIQEILGDGNRYFYRTAKDFKDDRMDVSMKLVNLSICRKGLIETISGYDQIIIYGAGILADKIIEELMNEEINIMAIAVTNVEGNPSDIRNIPVHTIDELVSYKDNALIMVAVQEKSQYEILRKLQTLGFQKIIALQGNLKECLLNEQLREYEF